jgi:predicted Zn finger-like uncharacterized protein
MLIVCPNCTTSYDVKPAALGDAGRTVRCASCGEKWFATPSSGPAPSSVPALFAASSPAAVAVAERAAPAPPPDPLDWDAPPESEPEPPAPAAAHAPAAEDEVAAMWGVPEAPAPPLVPQPEAVEASPSPPIEDVETLAARRLRRSSFRRFDRIDLPFLPTLVAVQLVVICAGLVWRAEIVHFLPQTASFFRAVGFGVNVRGLTFADLRTTKDSHDGVTVLIVEGSIVNTTGAMVAVPRLRFALRNTALAELFSWTAPPERGTLGAGESLPFRSRLASPPPDGNDILVRFLNRLDFVNGAR